MLRWTVALALLYAVVSGDTAFANAGEGDRLPKDGVANVACDSKYLDSSAGTSHAADYRFYIWIFVKADVPLQLKEACRRESLRGQNAALSFVQDSFKGEVTKYCSHKSQTECAARAALDEQPS